VTHSSSNRRQGHILESLVGSFNSANGPATATCYAAALSVSAVIVVFTRMVLIVIGTVLFNSVRHHRE
jgi:hypothetical protein